MSDDNRIDVADENEVPGLDLGLVQEQQARAKLNIPLYDSKKDKKEGKFHKLTGDERWRLEEYLTRPHVSAEHGEAMTEPSGGDHFKSKTYEELSEAIVDHVHRMQEAFEDIRGRIGIGEDGLIPEPGSEAERAMLDQVMEHVKGEIVRLHREGRTSESDHAYVNISRAHASFKEYVKHRKAYLGLSAYRKEHFASREAMREKQAQERAKEIKDAIAAEEEHKSILQRLVGKMR